MEINEMIAVADINSGTLRAAAQELGFSKVRFLGENGKDGDEHMVAYGYTPAGGDCELRYLVDNANGLFEEADPGAFADAVEGWLK